MDNQKTVLLFTITYLPIVGGAEVAIREIIKRLPEFRFVIVTDRIERGLPKYERVSEHVEVVRVGIPGHNIFSKNWYVIAAFFWSVRYALKNDVDVAWAVLESYGAMAASLIKLFIHDVYYVLTLQDGSGEVFWKRRIGWWNVVFKRVYHLADHITAISQYLIGRARSAYGYTGPVSLIPNGASEMFFEPLSIERKRELRKQWGLEETDKVIITTSRLVEKNGIDTLIEAFAILVNRLSDPNLPLKVRGTKGVMSQEESITPLTPLTLRGGQERSPKLVIIGDGKLRQQLELQVTRLASTIDSESRQASYPAEAGSRKLFETNTEVRNKLQGSVIFMGSVSNEIACDYVRAADVFCRPSRSEGQGISFVEAMAGRLVVVGTNVGGIPDFLEHNKNGYMARPDNPEELAQVLNMALEDSETNDSIRERAFVTATQYRWDTIAQKYRRVFSEVLGSVSVKKYVLFRQFVKYAIVGGLATVADFATFTTLTHAVGLYYVASNMLSVAVGMLVNFTLSRRWTFRVHDKPATKQFIAYATSTGIYLLLSSGLLLLMVEAFDLKRLTAKVVTVAIMTIWNFIMARYVVFRYF